jgi:hypothetical protein
MHTSLSLVSFRRVLDAWEPEPHQLYASVFLILRHQDHHQRLRPRVAHALVVAPSTLVVKVTTVCCRWAG